MKRGMALWCRLSRAGSSFAARMKRPASSDSFCEHGNRLGGGARLMGMFHFSGEGEAEGRAPSVRAASMQQTQHAIQRSVSELRGMLGLTSGLDALIADMLLLMSYSTKSQCAP